MKQSYKTCFLSLALVGLLCLIVLPASAQTEYLTPAQQKKELRKSLKEAKKVKSDYRESHLNVGAFNFKRGASSRKRVDPQEYDEAVMNPDGTPITDQKIKPKKKKVSKKKKKK